MYYIREKLFSNALLYLKNEKLYQKETKCMLKLKNDTFAWH